MKQRSALGHRAALELLRASLSWSTAWKNRTSLGEMGIWVGAYSKLLQVSEMSVYDLIRTLKECFDFFNFTKEEDLQKTENDKKTNCAVVKNILFFVKKCINIFPVSFVKSTKDSRIKLHSCR